MRQMRPLRFRSPPAWTSGLPAAADIHLWRRRGPVSRGPNSIDSDAVVAQLLAQQFGGSECHWRPARSAHGRPLWPQAPGFDLSISHSGDCWLLAVAGANRRIGIDIETLYERSRALELAERYFPSEEALILARLSPENRSRAFLRLWCAREAVLKAHGRGIAFGLNRLRFDIAPRQLGLVACDAELGSPHAWRIREFCPAPGLLGVLAWRGPPGRLRAFDAGDPDEV